MQVGSALGKKIPEESYGKLVGGDKYPGRPWRMLVYKFVFLANEEKNYRYPVVSRE